MSLKFRIIGKCFQDARNVSCGDADFLLEEDGWDDFNYHVMYHLHATTNRTHTHNEYLGPIRIMKLEQHEAESYLLSGALGYGKTFESLPENFFSLSTSIELYEGVYRLLPSSERRSFVGQLRLVLGKDSEYYETLENDACFYTALLRDTNINNYSLLKGRELLLGCTNYYNLQKQTVTVNFADVDAPINLNFSCLDGCKSQLIPNGIIAFIGKNGSGKSTAIYKLAKLLYANPDQRFRLKNISGTLHPNDLGISRLFIFSYSPFDNFVLPGVGGDDYKLLLKGLVNQDGRLIFCGVRDVQKEFEEILRNSNHDTYDNLFETERLETTNLKSIERLSEEFARAMNVIENNNDRLNIWNEVESSSLHLFPEINSVMEEIYLLSTHNEQANLFASLSTGYKFFLHSLAHLIAYIQNDSMVLFDEPENHIHPPMLSFMMTSIRKVLNKYQSVMLVATHSPVVLQEIFSDNVFVVRNDNGEKTISHPQIETYGANLSEITNEVFSLTTDVTNYYEAYQQLYEEWNADEKWTCADDMISSFEKHLKGHISSQLMAFLVNLFMDSNEAQ